MGNILVNSSEKLLVSVSSRITGLIGGSIIFFDNESQFNV